MDSNKVPLLEIRNISKNFPGVKALNGVNLELYQGEVLAVCGENGAGKSTLMKCISGIYQADGVEGEIIVDGKKVHFKNSLEAKKAGIIIVFQELSLIPDLTVTENIFLGNLQKTKYKLIDNKTMNLEAQKILNQIESQISVKDIVGELSISQQQMVEIARALSFGAKVVILDEPTSSLTQKEKDILFKNIRKLRESGVGIIYITHKMNEVFEISDRITVLRDGKRTGTLETKKVNVSDVVQLMIGRELDEFFHKSNAEIKEEVLRVENLSSFASFENISFDIKKGEIVGLYGLVGAGRSEIAETIFGVRKRNAGRIFIDGKSVRINSSKDAIRNGIGLVPENRKEQGLVIRMSCLHNISLAKLPKLRKGMFLNTNEEKKLFNEYKVSLSIATPGPNQKVLNLSGGNQQKIVVAKWLSLKPKILILDEPTRGIDVGAKVEIHKLIADLAQKGIAVLVISSEMPEILGISDKIITIANGRIKGVFENDGLTEKQLMESITIS